MIECFGVYIGCQIYFLVQVNNCIVIINGRVQMIVIGIEQVIVVGYVLNIWCSELVFVRCGIGFYIKF